MRTDVAINSIVLLASMTFSSIPAFGQHRMDRPVAAPRPVATVATETAEPPLADLRTAYGRNPTPRTAGELGERLAQADRWEEAETMLGIALAEPTDRWVAANRSALERWRSAARDRLVQVHIEANVPSARLIVNERSLGALALPTDVWVAAGTVTIEAAVPGFRSRIERLTVDSARADVMLRLDAMRAASSSSNVSVSPGWMALGIGSGVVAVAGYVMLGVAIGIRQNAAVEFNTRCPPIAEPQSAYCTTLVGLESEWGFVRWASLPVGVAFTALSIVGFYAATHTIRPERQSAGLRACGVSVSPMAVTCEIRF